ncbi:hepatocyte growth factor-regulated tyrosine kinase substrate isoform X2 [Hylaeus anthracinus]|uniref:hepatocyte growth factor-regulated tyrosine kinase substrate isoform X2 n=1 Tax=Hylaeus volcanicus TaxID=313075 RepID=UPI0023B85FA4|nr:hepatocyte growth factor-regulated tyrosine kinase substrate isoform X2 [Hylaeus volcanicus]XP_054007722.1 hepatocyte growth factor-regulated tyrosine kinase substrate isoform X2 [Hylaeus anthracinus]
MFRSTGNFDKLLDKATSHFQLEPDWVAILQICDLIRQGDVQPKAALAAIKKKVTNPNPHVALYALLVLESCVKNCGAFIHDEIGTKQYMEQLKDLVKTTTHDNVKLKTLELIQTWAHAFRNSPKYRAVQDTLNIMKAEGHKFPALKESDAMFIADTAPEWADGDVCHRCRVQFGVMQRKHHCRACGQVFCQMCSSKVSTLPKFGIEKGVRVCETCYDQLNKPSTIQNKEVDLPAEYLNSSLAQQQQVPPRKTAAELQEEEELNLAIALSQSEAEHKEKEKKRVTSSVLKSNTNTMNRTTYSPPPSPGPSPSKLQEEEEIEPELAKYLNRKYWEQRQTVIEEHASRADVTSPSAPNISSPMPGKIIVAKQQNGEVDSQMEEFVNALRSQVEIFVNRMKSNSSRGRSIANDSSVQTLFLNITAMHSRLLRYIQEQDDSRVYYEGLQDKLTQMKDARAALDALRDEHREKLRRQAEEAERKKQMLMAQKLAIMRKKKQEYLQYQRQLALQKIQEQEREMQMRQEQQKQQYIMVSGFIGPSQGSPVRHVQYQGPGSNYNPMSPTNQGYMYGQPSVKQYPMQGYSMPQMNAIPPHMMGPLPNQEQQPTDPSVQGHEAMGRVTVSGPGMMSQMTNPMPQLQQTGGHQMGPPPPQQGPPSHMTQSQPTSGHIPPQQGVPPQMPQQGPPGQIGILQSHMGPPPAQVGPGAHGPPGQVVGLPHQIGPQQPSTLPGPQGPSIQPHVSNTPISSQGSGTIPPSSRTVGPILTSNQTMQGPQGPAGLPTMEGMPQIPVSQGQQLQFQPAASLPPTSNESVQVKEDSKPETAELISFD